MRERDEYIYGCVRVCVYLTIGYQLMEYTRIMLLLCIMMAGNKELTMID